MLTDTLDNLVKAVNTIADREIQRLTAEQTFLQEVQKAQAPAAAQQNDKTAQGVLDSLAAYMVLE